LRTLDLHGHTLHNAWRLFLSFVYEKSLDKQKSVRIITGKGNMAKEFPIWCSNSPHVKSYKTEPHNLGSWEVRLR
jgi:DNA-nicking Smr family endonuclease